MKTDIHELDRVIILKDKSQYRILNLFDGYASCCKIGTTKLVAMNISVQTIQDGVEAGIFEIKRDKYTIFDANAYFSPDDPKDVESRTRYEAYKNICETVYREYKYQLSELARKTSKPIIDQMCEKYGVKRQIFWKVFVRYLQSGRQDVSLVDKRKTNQQVKKHYTVSTGRRTSDGKAAYMLTDKDLKIFTKYMKRYLNSQVKTQKEAYLDMVDDEYSTVAKTLNAQGEVEQIRMVLPPGSRPSMRQFLYYVSVHTNEKQRSESKLTANVVRNNMRPFTGTVMDGVQGPGHYVEMDAQEMDIALVSDEYKNIPVGRPIIYVMIDVMSEIVLGVSLAMDNNSIVGCANCFFSLIEDKEQLLKQYGVEVKLNSGYTIDDLWPTGYKPRIVKYDNGSDFISKPIAHMLNELNIREEIVSPASGSLKPLVENFFGLIKKDLDDLLEHKGLIRQTYGSKHHQEACLTFDEAYRIVLNHVIYHNMHVISTYAKSADMKEKRVIASPMNLWRYGMDNMVQATRFASREDAIYHMLIPCKDATVSRNGIFRKGMPYFNAEDDELQDIMFRQGTKKAKFDCRYDPRDMGHLYYLRNGELMTASLPTEDIRYRSYFYMSEKRYDELEAMDRDTRKLEEEINVQARISKRRANKAIVDEAAKAHEGRNDTKGMRDARKEEKEYISGQHSVAAKFGLGESPDAAKEISAQKDISVQSNRLDEHEPVSAQTAQATEAKSVPAQPDDKKKKDPYAGLTPEERRRKAIEEANAMDEYVYSAGVFGGGYDE